MSNKNSPLNNGNNFSSFNSPLIHDYNWNLDSNELLFLDLNNGGSGQNAGGNAGTHANKSATAVNSGSSVGDSNKTPNSTLTPNTNNDLDKEKDFYNKNMAMGQFPHVNAGMKNGPIQTQYQYPINEGHANNNPNLTMPQTMPQNIPPNLQHNINNFQFQQLKPQPRSKIRPCDHCRRRKTKCVMIPESNNCVQCASKGLKCTYQDSSVKRTNPSSGSSPVDSSNKRPKVENDPLRPPDVSIRETQPVQDYSSMPGNSLLKRTLSLQFPRSSFYVGPTSIFDISLLNCIKLDKIDQVQLNPTLSLRRVGPNVQFTLRDDYTEDLYEKSEKAVDDVEKFVAPHGQVLIDLYFRIVHPSFPILHKKVFLEKYSRTHREFSAPLLAAVYSLAIQWWDYDPQLNQYPKPNVNALNSLALKTFSEIIQRPKLSAVQAGLLLLQCKPDDSSNWVLCSQIVALSEELGLGLDCANWRLPKWERGLRRRLAWAVFVQDKWLALINSRPSHILAGTNWCVKDVTEDDFPEKHGDGDLKDGSTDIEIGKVLFTKMISLSEIVSDLMNTFYNLNTLEEQLKIDQVLMMAKPLQLRLRNWYHSLPVELQMSSVKPRKLCSNGYLQLAYFATELTLHRKIISCLGSDARPELVKVCRTAAKTRLLASIEFVRDLKPEHIHSFWHSSASSNFTLIGIFAAILFVTSESPEEASLYRDQIYNYRWILRVSSKGFDIASTSLERLNSVLNHVPGLLNDDGSPITPRVSVGGFQGNANGPQPLSNNSLSGISNNQPSSINGGNNMGNGNGNNNNNTMAQMSQQMNEQLSQQLHQHMNQQQQQAAQGFHNISSMNPQMNMNRSRVSTPHNLDWTPNSNPSPISTHSPISKLSPKEIIKQQQSVKINHGRKNSNRSVDSPLDVRNEDNEDKE